MAKLFNITAATAIVGVALYAAAGYVAVPYVIKTTLERSVSQSLHRQVRLTEVTFNPWTWRLEVVGLEIAALPGDTAAAPLLSIPLLRLDFSGQSVRHLAPVLDEVTIDGLKADVALSDPDIRDLLKQRSDDEGSGSSSGTSGKRMLPDFAIYNITVKNAMLHVTDKANGLDQSITDFNLSLPFVSTLPGAQESLVTPSLSFNLNGSTIYATGSTKPFGFTLEARLNFNIRDLDITPLTKMVPSLNTPMMQLNSGKLTTNLTVIFRNPTGGNPGRLLMSGTAQLRNLSTTQTNGNRTDTFFTVGNAALKIKQLDLIGRNADIESMSVDNAKLNIPTDSILLTSDTTATKGGSSAASASGTSPVSHWHWSVGSMRLSNAQVDLINTGLRKQPTISFTEMGADISGLSSDPEAEKANVAFSTKVLGGSISAKGTLAGSTMDGQIDVNAKQINLAQTSSFIQTYMRGALVGTLGANLKLVLAKGEPSLGGLVSLDGFTIKQGREQPLVTKSLQADIEAIAPLQKRATIRQVKWEQPALQVTNYRSGLNLTSLFSPLLNSEPAAAEPAAEDAKEKTAESTNSGWQWAVNEVVVNGGSIRYADQTTRPNVVLTAAPTQLTVKNITNDTQRPASFDLATVVAQGKVTAKGTYDFAKGALVTDVNTANLQLRDLSTLLVQSAGVGTKSGTLTSQGKVSWRSEGEIAYQGDAQLNGVSLVNNRNVALGAFATCNLKGIDFTKKGTAPAVTIARLELEQPQMKETKRVQELAGIASVIAKATGHEKTAERLQKADQAFNSARLTLENVRYENGRFSAKGLDSGTLAGKLLEKLAESLKK